MEYYIIYRSGLDRNNETDIHVMNAGYLLLYKI